MKKTAKLDVLVVYSASMAVSSSAKKFPSAFPFRLKSHQAGYNRSYAYFLDVCKKKDLKAGFTLSSDIIGPGLCQSYWTHSTGSWKKEPGRAEASQIFDKISPATKDQIQARQLLFSDKKVWAFNDQELFTTFFDKLETYQKLGEYALPTISIDSPQMERIATSLKQLDTLILHHPYSNDFSTDLVLKDRFGAGGNFVYKIPHKQAAGEIQKILLEFPQVKFILQPFLNFDSGFSYQGRNTSTDIRLIFQHNQLLQCYFRMAKSGDFRCNEHQGGELVYVSLKDIPPKVLLVAQKIVKKINKKNTLFALDFVISNSGNIYFLEGNIGPGIDWNDAKKVNRDMSKQLIRNIVEELAVRSRKQSPLHNLSQKIIPTKTTDLTSHRTLS